MCDKMTSTSDPVMEDDRVQVGDLTGDSNENGILV